MLGKLNSLRKPFIRVFLLIMVMLFTSNCVIVSAETIPAINKSSLAMYIGDTSQLVVTGTSSTVTYESLDTDVVTVDDKGLVTAKGVGDTYILAYTGSKFLVCYVVVKAPQISESVITIYINGTTKKLEILGNNEKVTWSSKNQKVAKVTEAGEVVPVGVGTTTIEGVIGGKTYSCKVLVVAPYINESNISLDTGESYKLSVVGSNGTVSFVSGNSKIAKVNTAGVVKGVKEGKTIITVKYQGVTYKVRVAVADNRLSISSDQLWINKSTELTLTFQNKQAGDGVTIKDTKDLVTIKTSKWSGNTLKITLEPKKSGTTELVVTRNGSTENLKVKISATKKSVMTAEEIYEKYAQAAVSIISYDAGGNETVGSGFFIDSGMVLTNYHVIDYANKMYMEDANGKEYQVKYLYDYDANNDLAVLGVEETNEEILFISNDSVATGDDVYTLGSPVELTGSISDGMVSYAKRYMEGINYIQFTAPISKSSGGGPLLNCYGEVIGVNTLTVSSGQNLNFAVKIAYLKQLDLTQKQDIKVLYEENKDKVEDTAAIVIIN